ncbi:transporter substrate-binding domain-containing protein [Oxalobacteraceae bacterium]|nr:transporter substrate-binding domain-containing protein [Oxalobacteraceae bacterium]
MPAKRWPWRRHLLRGALCALLLPGHGAQAATELRTAAQESTAPKYQAGEAGAGIVGLCIDVQRAIERIDPGLRFVGDQRWMPLVRIFTELSNGQQDVACALQRTRERLEKLNFIEPALVPIHYLLLARIDDQATVGSWDDVRRMGNSAVILANRGFASVTYLEELGGLTVDASAASPELNMQKLLSGRGRFFYHRTPGLQDFLKRTGAVGKVRILPTVMYSSQMYMAFGRHVERATTERIQRALAQLEASGELERIVRKWP